MKTILTFRFGTFLFALSAFALLCPIASAQDPCKGGDCQTAGGTTGDNEPTFPGGGGTTTPPNTPEPFTMALGAGAIGLYARRRFVKSRQVQAA